MKKFLYRLIQWTWGFPQSLVGLIILLLQRKNPHYPQQGAVVTTWHGHRGSLSLGMFLFLDIPHNSPQTPYERFLLSHEYGHTIQSLMLGPAYLLVVGLPSLIWASCFGAYRQRNGIPYDSVYPEKWASNLGRKYLRTK